MSSVCGLENAVGFWLEGVRLLAVFGVLGPFGVLSCLCQGVLG